MGRFATRVWNNGLGQSLFLFMAGLLIGPAVVGYAMRWDIRAVGDIGISVYAIHSILHFVIQVTCAEVNNWRMRKKAARRPEGWAASKVGIIVAGYREDPFMFEKCLNSIKDTSYSNVGKIVCVVDGNTDEDRYMAEAFGRVFGCGYDTLGYVLADDATMAPPPCVGPAVCFMQPHRGKREALYTAIKVVMEDPTIDAIITTDSDTILDHDAILELLYPLQDEGVGAVAGQVLIWNTDSLLTFIVGYRYWMSFNLERACQSAWRTVLCIAGPMGCYKVSLIRDVLDTWVNQRFLGNRCTYGDDRHLTNRILMQGKKVVYTPLAVGYTDTPYSFVRYLVQQIRWSKSFFREFFFTIGCVHKHFIWMGYELVYHFVYFFLLMYWMIHLLYTANIKTQAIAIMVTTGMSIVRAGYGALRTGDIRFLMFNLYTYVYYFVILPSKVTALLTMWDISWGTRGASTAGRVVEAVKTFSALLAWVGVNVGGFAYTAYKNWRFDVHGEIYRVGFAGLMAYLLFIAFNMSMYYLMHYTGISHTKLLKDIKREKQYSGGPPPSVEGGEEAMERA